MRKVIIVILILLAVCACDNGNGIYSELLTADSLLMKKENEAAYKLLMDINQKQISNRRDSALYNLLYVQAAYRLYLPNPNDSLLDVSIDYFKEEEANHYLMLSNYYKGCLLMDSQNYDRAIVYMKEAERLAMQANSLEWTLNTQESISLINQFSGNNNTAMVYAKKVLALALNMGDIDEICYAYNNIGVIFYQEKMNDSCYYYLQKIIPYTEELDSKSKAFMLSNIGRSYYTLYRYEEALHILQKSISITPTSRAFNNLALIYAQYKKDYMTADSIWKMALKDADFEERSAVYHAIAETSRERGLYEKAVKYTKLHAQMEDSIKKSQRREETLLAQKQFDQQQTKEDTDKYFRIGAFVISLLTLLIIAVIAYHRIMIRNSRKTLADIIKSRDEYSEKLAAISASEKQNAKDIKKLNSKIKELNDRQSEILAHGNELYNDIIAGGDMGKWSNKDVSDFIESYRFRNPNAVSQMEQTYNNLTPTKLLYLILADMKYEDTDIQRIMCKTDGAIRTLKSRIKSGINAT